MALQSRYGLSCSFADPGAPSRAGARNSVTPDPARVNQASHWRMGGQWAGQVSGYGLQVGRSNYGTGHAKFIVVRISMAGLIVEAGYTNKVENSIVLISA